MTAAIPHRPADHATLANAPNRASDVDATGADLCECLNPYKIQDIPDSIYYIPNFVNDEEAEELLTQVWFVCTRHQQRVQCS